MSAVLTGLVDVIATWRPFLLLVMAMKKVSNPLLSIFDCLSSQRHLYAECNILLKFSAEFYEICCMP